MKKILVVDDTKNIKILLKKCLQLQGFEVLTANDGFEALEMFVKESFDVAFLDIKLPRLSGTEVLKRIREMGIKTPVIIITAYATIKNTFECTQLGAVAYIQKPFTADKVKTILSEFFSLNKFQIVLKKDSIQIAESLIFDNKFYDAEVLLKNSLSTEPLNSKIYFLLSEVSNKLGKQEDAEKFRLISTCLENPKKLCP